jgi:hypothetical protein
MIQHLNDIRVILRAQEFDFVGDCWALHVRVDCLNGDFFPTLIHVEGLGMEFIFKSVGMGRL